MACDAAQAKRAADLQEHLFPGEARERKEERKRIALEEVRMQYESRKAARAGEWERRAGGGGGVRARQAQS